MSFSKKWSEQITSDLLVRKYIFTSFYGCWDEAIFQFSIFLRCVQKNWCVVLAIQKTHEEEVDDDTLLQNEKFRLKYYMGVSRYLRIKSSYFRKKDTKN